MNKKFFIILLLLVLLVPNKIFAICEGPIVPCGGCAEFDPNDKTICLTPQSNCEFCHIFVLINNLLMFVLTCLTPIIGAAMLVWGGFTFLGAGQSPAKVEQAKGIITAVVIGIVIIFVAWVFLNSFLASIGVAEWTGLTDDPATEEVEEGWWRIQCP
ncbi:MAG: hypothetical protein ACKKMW_01035 [Candidatus Nealsonbacteria bacterium]